MFVQKSFDESISFKKFDLKVKAKFAVIFSCFFFECHIAVKLLWDRPVEVEKVHTLCDSQSMCL